MKRLRIWYILQKIFIPLAEIRIFNRSTSNQSATISYVEGRFLKCSLRFKADANFDVNAFANLIQRSNGPNVSDDNVIYGLLILFAAT